MCVREKKEDEEKTETSLHTFYRLLFTYSQGLYSMELDEERKKKKKTERERERVKEKKRQSNFTAK